MIVDVCVCVCVTADVCPITDACDCDVSVWLQTCVIAIWVCVIATE